MLHRMDLEVVTWSKTFLYTWVIKDYSFKSIFVEDVKGVFSENVILEYVDLLQVTVELVSNLPRGLSL